ncbi:MAG TPA: hypothetical protein VMI56_02595, partial [Reyranella sp.]|nr:hypothetical protein [Reyranella sp.]
LLEFRLSTSGERRRCIASNAQILEEASGGAPMAMHLGAHTEAERRWLEGPKLSFGLRPFLIYCFFFLAAFFFAAFFLAAITVSYG